MNTRTENKIYIGIDWGTHSSKGACYESAKSCYLDWMPILSSDLLCTDDCLIFNPPEEVGNREEIRRGLKEVLINDPLGAHFWNSERLDTRTSLGEAVSFSLCCLLAEAKRSIEKDFGTIKGLEVEVGFSFPNWLVNPRRTFRVASKNFHQACSVAIALFSLLKSEDLPQPGIPFPISNMKRMVDSVLKDACTKEDIELNVRNVSEEIFPSLREEIKWCYIMESGAAGLPYLRATHIENIAGVPGLAKLLVIDVGAGSTDVGYMLRVISRKEQRERFYYFPPATSFNVAGNKLTNDLLEYYSAAGDPITYMEAEIRKLRQTGWHNLAFVQEWRRQICQHVSEYVQSIPDERWLPMPVNLNVIITGGSGLVPGLKDELGEAIRSALERKRFDNRTVNCVVFKDEQLPSIDFSTKAEYARRAVCLGASDFDKPGFRYIQKMDPPTAPRVVGGPAWV